MPPTQPSQGILANTKLHSSYDVTICEQIITNLESWSEVVRVLAKRLVEAECEIARLKKQVPALREEKHKP